ncbi:MAG: acetyl-CoA carboxylase biotin carboxylase subunit [Phycisphaerae bacterium]|nr:acetyl-CoA carboxylase biotin carboxylase subunit [Phycisphaerae bacterium]
MFSKVLIANRGEIALRVIRACRELGIDSVVVYSQADKDAEYVKAADESVCIGPALATESYLNIPRIISAAEITNVEAIHPGYGFLAENAHFAEVCRDCKIKFIGPSPESMKLLGDKVAARDCAIRAKVPVVPGSDGAVTSEEHAVELAEKIGYPVMIKASAGGGGRGMRIAHNEVNLRTAFHSAQTEAGAAFNNSEVFMEKYISKARHVEVQVLADEHGNAVHLWERDCSMQRRYQKVIEEAPSPGISQETREALCKSALRLVKESEYINAGTVEYLVADNGEFYFGEVNTRIQVEHPVTEMVTGVDLVKWQILIASGQKLTLKQKDIKVNGSAIECRINAEDPACNYRPCPGKIEHFVAPGGIGVRVDTHAYGGYTISPHYDSMIGKLIVHKPNRQEAIATMKRALHEFKIDPIKTSIPLCMNIMNHPDYIKGNIDTGWIERTF